MKISRILEIAVAATAIAGVAMGQSWGAGLAIFSAGWLVGGFVAAKEFQTIMLKRTGLKRVPRHGSKS